MLIYLYGPDSYRKTQKLKELVNAYRTKNPELHPVSFSLTEDESVQKLERFIRDQSLFTTAKLAIVHDAEKEPKLSAVLKEILEDKKTHVILISEKKLTTGFPFLYRKPVLAEQFEILKGKELAAFIIKEGEARDIKLSTETLSALIENFGTDTWGLINELEKISLGGTLPTKNNTPQFFPLIQTLKGSADISRKLAALEYLLDSEDPAAIFNITAAIAQPEQKQKFADYDIAVKSGKLEYEEVLLDFVLTN